MTIMDWIARNPAEFCDQNWYHGHQFASQLDARSPVRAPPTGIVSAIESSAFPDVPRAVDLVAAYLQNPGHAVWQDYLWTRDLSDDGYQVYVGGMGNGRGFEIHRHLDIGTRWGFPVWR